MAQLQAENPGGPAGDLDAPLGGGFVVLYDQTDNASGNGAPDQDFEAAFDIYDSEGADDFVIPFGEAWNILEVSTIGSSGGSADSVNIRFLQDNGGSPGAEVPGCVYPGLTPMQAGGSFTITLPAACNLDAGTYWLAQQTVQNFGLNGQHFWSNRSVQSGSESHWRNPGNGFGTGCTNFAPQTSCGVGGGVSPDFLFAIAGTVEGGRATFDTSKVFNDNNDAEVEVTLSCNTGLPLEQTTTISEGDPVNFVINDFEPGTLDCTITEVVPDGYTPSYNDGTVSATNCSYEDISGGAFRCIITNSLNLVEVEVDKVWIDENPQFNAVNIAEAFWSCTNVAFGSSSGYLDFFGNPGEDSFFVYPDWDTGTNCAVTEINVPDGGVEVDGSDCASITVWPGMGGSCTIFNTRLYEGIPTLSQYGLGILALMMLGMGFVAYRRLI